ncbi:MAG: hypothetical protein QW199_01205 [Candidatus Pacearchaeota archaeon]
MDRKKFSSLEEKLTEIVREYFGDEAKLKKIEGNRLPVVYKKDPLKGEEVPVAQIAVYSDSYEIIKIR